jgi:outer membrane protein TolC
MRAAEARLIAANFDIGAARAAFLPSVTLSASVGLTAKSLSKFFPATVLTDTALGLAQPILEGGRLQGQLDFDRAHVRELIATYRQTALTAFQDVEDALSAKRRLKALAAANLDAVTSARRSQALAEQQYKLGSADYLTVLNTQRTLFQAEDAYLQVRLQQFQAAISLFRALGGGFAGTSGTGTIPPAPPSAGPASQPI